MMTRLTFAVLLLCAWTDAWVTQPTAVNSAVKFALTTSRSRLLRTTTTRLHYLLADDGYDHSDYSDFLSQPSQQQRRRHNEDARDAHLTRRRASLEGMSIAPDGNFWVILKVAEDGYVPIQLTEDPTDAEAAAGPILPEDILAHLAVLESERVLIEVEEEPHTTSSSSSNQTLEVARKILAQVPSKLPQVTLDEVVISSRASAEGEARNDHFTFKLSCQIHKIGSLSISPTRSMSEATLHPAESTAKAFLPLALALRYQVPITTVFPKDTKSGESGNHELVLSRSKLKERFPMVVSLDTLQQDGLDFMK